MVRFVMPVLAAWSAAKDGLAATLPRAREATARPRRYFIAFSKRNWPDLKRAGQLAYCISLPRAAAPCRTPLPAIFFSEAKARQSKVLKRPGAQVYDGRGSLYAEEPEF